MAIVDDVWIRRLWGASDTAHEGPADFVYVRADTGATGIWGPVLASQSMFVVGVLRERIVGRALEEAAAALAAATAERHGTGYLAMACTACDLALWDLRGREAGAPVATLLGVPVRDHVPCYASLMGSDLFDPPPAAHLKALAETYWGLKWAARLDVSAGRAGILRTVRALAALREMGLARLMVDALCAWTLDHAREFLTACEGLDLAWVEEPLPANDLASYRALARQTSTPLAAGEHAYSARDIANLIDCGVSVLQPDGGWCGGLAAFMDAVGHAAKARRTTFPHGCGLLPALHASVHHPDAVIPALEFHLTVEPRRQAFWRDKITPANGVLRLPVTPGLGIVINEEVVGSSVEIRRLEWVCS
jgi:L-alanine-DL-glutamate epimerase-like enolase superfamily enzyme